MSDHEPAAPVRELTITIPLPAWASTLPSQALASLRETVERAAFLSVAFVLTEMTPYDLYERLHGANPE